MSFIKTLRQYRIVSLHIVSYHFNPGLFSTLITIALLYTMMSLGFWQLTRAEFKDTLQQKIIERKKLSPLTLEQLPVAKEQRRYLPVTISGEFDNQHSFLLDNITLNGQVGYHVLTPLKVNATTTILVNRGFIAQGKSREQLPELEAPTATLELSGLLDFQPAHALILADNVQDASRWPVVLQYVDLIEIGQFLNTEMYDMVVWLNPEQSGSYAYNLPVLNLNAAKNNGYAFQWFAMSLALFIIYIVVNTKQKNK